MAVPLTRDGDHRSTPDVTVDEQIPGVAAVADVRMRLRIAASGATGFFLGMQLRIIGSRLQKQVAGLATCEPVQCREVDPCGRRRHYAFEVYLSE